jgi:hypothetical protein
MPTAVRRCASFNNLAIYIDGCYIGHTFCTCRGTGGNCCALLWLGVTSSARFLSRVGRSTEYQTCPSTYPIGCGHRLVFLIDFRGSILPSTTQWTKLGVLTKLTFKLKLPQSSLRNCDCKPKIAQGRALLSRRLQVCKAAFGSVRHTRNTLTISLAFLA